MTRQVTDKLYIELDYFTPEQYYTYEAVAVSTQSTQFTITCDAGIVINRQISVNLEFNQVATISHIEGADLFAFANASVTAQADRIRASNSQQSSSFEQNLSVNITRTFESQIASSLSQSISEQRVRYSNSSITTEFALSTLIDKIKLALADLLDSVSVSCDANKIQAGKIEGNATLNSQGTISAQASKIANGIVSLQSEFSQSATISHIEGADLFALSEALIAVQVSRIRENNTAASDVFDIATDFVVTRSADADVDSVLSINIDGLRSRDTQIETQAAFSFECIAVKTTENVSSLQAQFDLTGTISHIEGADIVAFTDAMVVTQAERTRDYTANISTELQSSVNETRFRYFDSAISSSTSISISIDIFRNVQVDLQGQANLQSSIEIIKSASVDLQNNFVQTTQEDLFKSFVVSLSSNFITSTQAVRIRYFDSNQNLSSSLTGNFIVVKDAHLIGTGVAAITCNAIKTVSAVLNANVTANQVSVIGRRNQYQATIRGFASILVSRNAGPYPPQTLTGTFSSINLQNSANRISNLTGLNSDNWFYETDVGISSSTGNTQSMDNRRLFYIPLGTRNGVTSYFQAVARYRGSEGFTITFQFLLGGNFGNGTTMNTPTSATYSQGVGLSAFYAKFAVSFTGGQRLALYINNTRVALYTNYQTSGWTIPKNQTVQFAPDFPFTLNSVVHSAQTEYAWLVKGDFTNNGNTTYVSQSPRVYTENTIFLYEFNGNGQETTALTQTTTANLSKTSSVNVLSNYISGFRSNITSQSTVNAVVGKVNEINLVAFTNGNLSAAVGRITRTSANVNASVNQSTLSDRIRFNSSQINSQATVNATISHIKSFNSNSSSNFTVSTNADRTRNSISQAQAEFNLSARIGKQQAIDLLAFTNGSLTVNANIIKGYQSNIGVVGTLSNTFDRIRPYNSNQSSSFSSTLINDRIRSVVSIFTSISIELIANNYVKGTVINLTGRADTKKPYAEEDYVDDDYATNFDIVANYIVDNQQSISSSFALLANITIATEGAALVASSGTMSIAAVKTVRTSSNNLSNSNTNIVIAKFTSYIATLSSEFTLFSNIGTAEEIFGNLFNNAAVICRIDGTLQASSSLQSQFTQNTNTADSLNIRGSANISTTASISIAGSRIRFGNANISALAFELADGDVQTTTNINCLATTSLTVNVEIFRITSSTITSSTNLSADARRTRLSEITITSAMTFVSAVRDIRLDEIEYKIPAEGWEYKIVGENREYDIIGETRLRSIASESRIRRIDGETRIYIVEQ